MRGPIRLASFVCAMILAAPMARAQPSTAPQPSASPTADDATMVERFEHAQQLYRQGRFDESAEELVALIAIRPEPVLFYNLARAYDGDGRLAEAIESYERYLELDPNIDDRGAITGRIATLREQLAERERTARPAPPPPPVPAKVDDGPIVLPWVMLGVGAATLVAGAVLGGLSRSERSAAGEETVHAEAVDALDAAERFALGANISFVAGGLLGAAGATWLVVDAATAPEPPSDEIGLRLTFRL